MSRMLFSCDWMPRASSGILFPGLKARGSNGRNRVKRAKPIRSLAGMLLCLCLISGCASLPAVFGPNPNAPPPDYVNVVQTEEVRLQLVPRDPAAPPNDHPAAFTPEQMHVLLMALRVTSEGEGKMTFASPGRLKKVAAALSEGLAEAGPRQDLKLVFFRTKASNLLFGSSQRVTTARVFFRDNTLHLIFGELDAFNSPYRDVTIEPHTPGERNEPTDVNGRRLVANDAWRWHGSRRDWIEMGASVKAIAEAARAAPQVVSVGENESARALEYGPAAGAAPVVTPEAAPSAYGPAATAGRPRPESQSSTRAEPEAPASEPQPATPAVPVNPEAAAWAKIEKRLTVLERLYEKGLITRQDYEAKKEELLSELP